MSKMPKPSWQIEVAVRVGEAAYTLSMEHRGALQARLPAGTMVRLGADLASLRDVAAGAQVARATKHSATAAQQDAARNGFRLVRSIRSAVREARPADKALHKAFGVGVKVIAVKIRPEGPE